MMEADMTVTIIEDEAMLSNLSAIVMMCDVEGHTVKSAQVDAGRRI